MRNVIFCSLFLPLSVQADLLFYEPFDYPAGESIGGQIPSLGAEGGWIDTSSGNGTPNNTPASQPLTVRANGTNGGAISAQTWTGIPSSSIFPNSGGYLEGMRRDNNEASIALSPLVTSQFTDGAVIWLSYVSAATTNTATNNNHEPNFAIGSAPIGGGTLDRARVAQGEAVGVGSSFNESDSRIQAAYWEPNNFEINLSGDNIIPDGPVFQQLIVTRIEFGAAGETIATNVFDLNADLIPIEADFDDGAVSIMTASNLDQSLFDTLSFDAVRANIDEIRIATTFDEVVGGISGSEPLGRRLTNLSYDRANDEFTFTWVSNLEGFTGLYWSQDLKYFFPEANNTMLPNPDGFEATFGPVANPVPNADKMFFRLGDPDTDSPTVLASSTDGSEITLVFSEPLLTGTPDDVANYFLEDPDGNSIAITDARIGERPDQVILTLSQDLIFGTTYSLTIDGVSDPVGNAIVANTEIDITSTDPALGIPLIINEVMASNRLSPYNPIAFNDEDGDSSDWVEIHNPLPFPIDLDGWFLTDDIDEPAKWTFPPVIIPSSGYVLVFASGKNRANLTGELHTNFQLSGDGEYLALNMPDQRTMSEFSPEYPEQTSGVSYGLPIGNANSPENFRYFDVPTPGFVNSGIGFIGIVDDTNFDMDRGLYDAPFSVNISSDTPEAVIRYTLDMTEPTLTNGFSFTEGVPLQVDNTTCLRARAFLTGWLPSNTDTQSYLFPASVPSQSSTIPGFPDTWGSVPADYAMDPFVTARFSDAEFDEALRSLPSISIVTDMENLFDGASGIYANPRSEGIAWERPTSVEWIDHTGGPEFQVDAGLRIQGNAARDLPKKPFRLLFKSIYGPSRLNFPVFSDAQDAVESFDTIILRANAQGLRFGARTQITDENGRRTALDMGTPQAHGTYAHLYVNGAYWGVYNPSERPQASFCENYIAGGKDDWDVNNGDNAIDGVYDPFDELLAQVRGGSADDAAFQRIQGNNVDGTPNPAFPAYIDMPNYIDYMLCNFYLGTGDWAGNASQGTRNYYTGRWRAPSTRGYQWFVWDAERSLQEVIPTTVSFGPAEPFVWLRGNEEFRLQFADHAQRHLLNDGALTVDDRLARYTELVETLRPVMKLAEARWDRTTVEIFEEDVADRSSNWFPSRVPLVLSRFRSDNLFPSIDAPLYSTHGGSVSPTTPVILGTEADTIYFTLDGSDPRLTGGAVSETAQLATFSEVTLEPMTFVTTGYEWSYLDDGSDQGTAWQATDFDDSSWESGPSQLGYGDPSATVVSFGLSAVNKFATTYFRTEVTIDDPSEWSHFTMRLQFDDGIAVYLNGEEIQRVNLGADAAFDDFASAPVTNENDFKDFRVETSSFVAGVNTFAVEIHQVLPNNSDIRLDMELIGEVVGDENTIFADPIFFSEPTTLQARARDSVTGEWSALNTAFFSIDTAPASSSNLVISEVHYRPAQPVTDDEIAAASDRGDFEFIELLNIGDTTVDLSGLNFSDGIEFTFADQSTLAAGARLVVVRDLGAFTARYGSISPAIIAGEYSGGLSNDGERIALADASGVDFIEFTYNDQLPWPVEADGDGPTLLLTSPETNPELNDAINWQAHPTIGGTPGFAN